ncbi:hypothetical protein GIV42_15540, partial [Pseudomonas syringae]
MRREEKLRQFDIRTRNQLRAILSDKDGNAITRLAKLSKNFGNAQLKALEAILNSSALTKAVRKSDLFPRNPPFFDTLQEYRNLDLNELLGSIEDSTRTNRKRLLQLTNSLYNIDLLYSTKSFSACVEKIIETLKHDGWSHSLLRRIVLIRENLEEGNVDERIEKLILQAGIKGVVTSSLIHTYTQDQSILTSKRAVLNIVDRGTINRYTRTLSKLSIQPFASSVKDFEEYLKEILKCSLLDAII